MPDFQVESLEAVSEELRGVYDQVENGYALNVDKYAELKATGLKNKNKELLSNQAKLKTDFAKFERFKPIVDADEAEAEQFLTAWEKRNEQAANKEHGASKADLDAAKDKAHAREIKKREEELAKHKAELENATKALREYQLWTPLRDMFIKSGGDPADWSHARRELAEQSRFDFDESGKIVVMQDGYADTIAPENFFKTIYPEQSPKFYRPTGAAGTGSVNGTAGAVTGAVRISREQAKNPAVYRAAKDKATKANVELQITD